MRLPRNSRLGGLARNLRNNATRTERKLWFEFLRTYQPQWHRQTIVQSFILDFYCPQVRIAIELDGGQHYENEVVKQDYQRTILLHDLGITTLRFTNYEVSGNFDQVCLAIDEEVRSALAEARSSQPP